MDYLQRYLNFYYLLSTQDQSALLVFMSYREHHLKFGHDSFGNLELHRLQKAVRNTLNTLQVDVKSDVKPTVLL